MAGQVRLTYNKNILRISQDASHMYMSLDIDVSLVDISINLLGNTCTWIKLHGIANMPQLPLDSYWFQSAHDCSLGFRLGMPFSFKILSGHNLDMVMKVKEQACKHGEHRHERKALLFDNTLYLILS